MPAFIYFNKITLFLHLEHVTSTKVSKVASLTDNSRYIPQYNFKNRMWEVCVYTVLQMSF